MINALARSLLASGSSPQMHQTCAKVTAALSRYTIDSTTSTEDAEEILRELSQPLANLVSGLEFFSIPQAFAKFFWLFSFSFSCLQAWWLMSLVSISAAAAPAGKLEPVAGGAAACLQALVETDNWKRASSDLVHEICQRTIAALNEKSTRTVAHMHLIRALASVNADILSIYGTSLLRAGAEILMLGSSPWQQRMSAAKLLQDVLTILDKETLTFELPFTMQVWQKEKPSRLWKICVTSKHAVWVCSYFWHSCWFFLLALSSIAFGLSFSRLFGIKHP